MAEYIDRDKVLVELECGIRAGNYEKGYEKYMHINSMDDCFDTVKYFDTADVVERSEYVESQKEVMRLRDLSHKVNQDAMHYEEMYRELHRKIDKAIEEMKEEYDNFKYSDNKTLGASFGIRKAIDILEKNLGE